MAIAVVSSKFPISWPGGPRVLLGPVEEGCFFKLVGGPFSFASGGATIDMILFQQSSGLRWTLGGSGAATGAAVSCAVLGP